ncbi:hypothetical protein [Tateyamaria sp. SN6-1]|uniref:hypothetical protein n=1 Tax=Tateyamaria sp. SN6-1 TaxID=3092148 RepID=UPI0039F56071
MRGGFFGTRVRFGDTPDKVAPAVYRNAWVLVLIGPCFYIAALTQLPEPLAPFRGTFGAGIAALSWVGTGILILINLAPVLLIYAKRAAGLFLLVAGFMYLNGMVSALMISVVPLGSPVFLVGTVLLSAWSLVGLRRVNAQVPDTTIDALRRERLQVDNGQVVLLPASAIDGGGIATTALSGLRSAWASVFEFAGVLILVVVGGFLTPVVIATDFGTNSPLALILWFASMALMLAARGSVNTWLLIARAMARGPVAHTSSESVPQDGRT